MANDERGEALSYFREAAGRGDVRAMVTLGLLLEAGDGVPPDPEQAVSLYRRAADLGSPDGAINLGFAMFEGIGGVADPAGAVEMMRRASRAGSGIADLNLGFLAQQGVGGDQIIALDYFKRAGVRGERRAFIEAAILLDEGDQIDRDPAQAADFLLKAAALDSGRAIAWIEERPDEWSKDTLLEVQNRLKRAELFLGDAEQLSQPELLKALKLWRYGGYDPEMTDG